mgnify:CR=1 FL=1
MPDTQPFDPTQRPNIHRDLETFDDPVRKVGPDATAVFDNSNSDPTDRAGSEALGTAGSDQQDDIPGDGDGDFGVRADALDTGIDDADQVRIEQRADIDEEDEADEEDLDIENDEEDDLDEDEDRVSRTNPLP